MSELTRIPEPSEGDERSILLGWLAFHRNALEAKCHRLTPEQLADRALPPSTLCLLGLVRHLTEMERTYLAWALGPKIPLKPVWGDYVDGGPEWDFDADASMAAETMAAWDREKQAADALISQYDSLDLHGTGNGHTVRWNLQKLTLEYARHNGHAALLRQRIDGQTGE
jgi:hypothetical protein